MLSDNIRRYRKENNMSQDELAEQLGVSRQSISLWETGQTQPTIDNIIALSKLFGISSDVLLGTADSPADMINEPQEKTLAEKKKKTRTIIIILIAAAVMIGGVFCFVHFMNIGSKDAGNNSISQPDSSPAAGASDQAESEPDNGNAADKNSKPVVSDFDIFSCCKDFAIENGTLNGDFCIYQQPSTLYGGYDNEYFSISYWGDSDMVEFCLHCPLDDTYSVNFYLRMRGGYDKKYEYLSSRYYRNNGESIRSATGSIDPAVFSNHYPLNCDQYVGSFEGQNSFMEESRVGLCDLIYCLKQFVEIEDIKCDFSDFDFVNF